MDNAQLNASAYRPPAQAQKKKGITGSTIKIIAVVTMLIDHVAAALLTRILISRGFFYAMGNEQRLIEWMKVNGLLYIVTQLMRLIGRLGFPIFCFLLVEGFQRTRNVKKYAFRMGLFALISEMPFDLAFSGRVWNPGYQNVYFTLLIGLLALWAFDAIAKLDPAKWLQVLLTIGGILLLPLYVARRGYNIVTGVINFLAGFFGKGVRLYERNLPLLGGIFIVCLAVMLAVWGIYRQKKGVDKAWRMCGDMVVLVLAMAAANLLKTDYSGMGVLTIAVMYALRKNKVGSMAGGCITLTIASLSEITAFFAMLPIAYYNGERGLKMKYFFYIFYPAHLLIIWLICWAMGIGWISAI
ncbi:MAG: conjugal transfer protein TraX [Acetatifactor sp.]|nr:conjugal transfer protein TraX [Acetatifactor sp.]